MTDKELRRMSRLELLEILIEQMEENERLRQELNKVQTELEHMQFAVKRVAPWRRLPWRSTESLRRRTRRPKTIWKMCAVWQRRGAASNGIRTT